MKRWSLLPSHDFILVKHTDNPLPELFALQPVDNGVQSRGDNVKHDGRHLPVVGPLRVAVHDHGGEG